MAQNSDKDITFYPFIIGCLIICGIWLGNIWLNIYLFENAHNNYAAWFGDSFGGINTLFSGLAFAGIIYTILLQKKELRLQREELKETRKELKRSADAQEKAEAAFKKQTELMNKSALLEGLSQAVQFYREDLKYAIDTHINSDSGEKLAKTKKQITRVINELYQDFENSKKDNI